MKGEIDLYKQPLFVWNETHPVDAARWAIDQLLYGILWCIEFSAGIPKETLKYFPYKEEL